MPAELTEEWKESMEELKRTYEILPKQGTEKNAGMRDNEKEKSNEDVQNK